MATKDVASIIAHCRNTRPDAYNVAMLDFEEELGKAVKYFWQVRGKQKKRQGGKTGKKDAGERTQSLAASMLMAL